MQGDGSPILSFTDVSRFHEGKHLDRFADGDGWFTRFEKGHDLAHQRYVIASSFLCDDRFASKNCYLVWGMTRPQAVDNPGVSIPPKGRLADFEKSKMPTWHFPLNGGW